MAAFTVVDKGFFPLRNTDAVVALFREHLERRSEPNLALLSIVLGALENSLTVARSQVGKTRADERSKPNSSPDDSAPGECAESVAPEPTARASSVRSSTPLSALQLSVVETLYEQFVTIVKGSIDLSGHIEKYTTTSLVKKVSDVIWSSLTRTYYKDRAHLQTIFSLLTENKLDGFGMAIGVIAACQVLGLNDVHLALSEDHAWAVFGDPAKPESAEITWHGKGSEDRRGQPVVCNSAEKSWLYLPPVICTRQMEVTAMVTAINPAINSTTDSLDMSVLKQKLLWVLHDLGHLDKYPASLATIADMEEANPTPDRPPSLTLYMKAIDSARQHYDNSHIYPYTFIGNYYYRRADYKAALRSWAEAAQVISRYNYNRDDEEVYKEFLEIANEMIPNAMRVSASVTEQPAAETSAEPAATAAVPLTSDPQSYAYLLQFYDGLCEWEEGSSTPVLHITWATHALYSLNRFDAKARTNLILKNAVVDEDSKSDDLAARGTKSKRMSEDGTRQRARASKKLSVAIPQNETGESLDKKSPFESDNSNDSTSTQESTVKADAGDLEKCTENSAKKPTSNDKAIKDADSEETGVSKMEGEYGTWPLPQATLVLRSEKMMGMKDLLGAERLNSGAIKLQLTAQSQVYFKQSRVAATPDQTVPSDSVSSASAQRKRARRE